MKCVTLLSVKQRKANQIFYNLSANVTSEPKVWKPLTTEEFDVDLGILTTTDVRHSNNFKHTKEMWETYAYPLYRSSFQ